VFTGGPEVIFSGTVVDTTGASLTGALVSINGQTATTNKQGYFFLQLPHEDSHYILNIGKSGYALFSRVFFAEFVAADFSLEPIS
jgi:hypothetical protein